MRPLIFLAIVLSLCAAAGYRYERARQPQPPPIRYVLPDVSEWRATVGPMHSAEPLRVSL